MFDTLRPEVDQFSVTGAGQHEIADKLRAMLIGEMANGLQFENGALIDEQVEEVRFAEISVLGHHGNFDHRARSECIGQFMLICILVKKPSQLVVDLECFLHHLVSNIAERILIEDTEVFAKFDWHGKVLAANSNGRKMNG
jgi:hypothetical protein